MKNIIKTDNYLLVVSDEEIKEGDCVIDNVGRIWIKMEDCFVKAAKDNAYGKSYKIIAHLPLNNSPILEGVDLLPPLEDEVDKLADELTSHLAFPEERRYGIYIGYNKAKEKYKYTEDDMIIAIQQAFLSGVERLEDFGKVESMLMENIQQPKYPIGFECELHETQVRDINTHELIKGRKKTTTNSQGQTVLEGKYIYE